MCSRGLDQFYRQAQSRAKPLNAAGDDVVGALIYGWIWLGRNHFKSGKSGKLSGDILNEPLGKKKQVFGGVVECHEWRHHHGRDADRG